MARLRAYGGGGAIGAAYIASLEYEAEAGEGHAVRVVLHDLLDADADLSGDVGYDDYLAVKGKFGLTGADWPAGDFDFDGDVDVLDYVMLKMNFGEAVPGASAVPEPASLVLLAGGALALLRRRR